MWMHSKISTVLCMILTVGWRWTASRPITAMSCCLSRCFQQSNVSQNVVYSQNNMLLTAKLVIFRVLWFPMVNVVALDRWGGKWNHLSMTHRLATNYAKTPIVKVIVENVVTCFLGTQCISNWFKCNIVSGLPVIRYFRRLSNYTWCYSPMTHFCPSVSSCIPRGQRQRKWFRVATHRCEHPLDSQGLAPVNSHTHWLLFTTCDQLNTTFLISSYDPDLLWNHSRTFFVNPQTFFVPLNSPTRSCCWGKSFEQ